MKTIEFRTVCYRCKRVINREFVEKDNWEGSKIVERFGVCIICKNKKEDRNGNLESIRNYLGRGVYGKLEISQRKWLQPTQKRGEKSATKNR